jgi:hypothetical protein
VSDRVVEKIWLVVYPIAGVETFEHESEAAECVRTHNGAYALGPIEVPKSLPHLQARVVPQQVVLEPRPAPEPGPSDLDPFPDAW